VRKTLADQISGMVKMAEKKDWKLKAGVKELQSKIAHSLQLWY
jgi:hypothetical protein